MTSQTENTDFDMKLVDLLQKKFSEEKKAHGETTLQLLSAQAQAQTAEAQAAKAQELAKETTLKLDQAREEIKGLRAQAQDAQTQAQDAQAKINDLEAQLVQMRLSEQSQTQSAIEAQEAVRSLQAQNQELGTARAKVASLESRMVKARAFFAEVEVETISEPIDQTQELKAKIESLEIQMAQMKVVEQFQAQVQELKVAHAKITELEGQMAQSEKQATEEVLLLNSEIRGLRAQTQELLVAQAQVKDLESQAQETQAKIKDMEAQTQELLVAQAQVEDLETQAQEAQTKIKDLETQMTQMRLSEQSQAQAAIEAQEEVRSLRAQAEKLVKAEAKIRDLEAQVTKPLVQVHVPLSAEWYALSWTSHEQLFRIKQSSGISYFAAPVSANTHLLFCKFVPDETAFLELAVPDVTLISWFRVIVSDGKRWTILGQMGPFNSTILIEKRMLRRAPSRINADGNKEYKLVICCERLPDDTTISSY